MYNKRMLFNSLKKIFAILLQEHGAFFLLALFFIIAISFFFLGKLIANLEAKAKIKERISSERADALKRSRAVLGGLAGEQLAPFFPGFPCNPGEARFIGKPVDFVAFCGAAENKPINEILLIEVKTGGATLSEREKQIRDCVEKGSVRFCVYNVPEKNL